MLGFKKCWAKQLVSQKIVKLRDLREWSIPKTNVWSQIWEGGYQSTCACGWVVAEAMCRLDGWLLNTDYKTHCSTLIIKPTMFSTKSLSFRTKVAINSKILVNLLREKMFSKLFHSFFLYHTVSWKNPE